ncbi:MULTISPECIES: hypothetical protein [Asticcacaulis]|uniref:hypothetical protein n=1 Tax=Asticcacaulis TaxID=76890 RepID=UPI001AE339C5|nr:MULTISPECIES: hypothetical protein [Asticcacaulis]MBP2161286.1 hypothetical protein [Asticcacaulis solisilvae]MDR6802348.1 hypothetical protein [Asticcacaulis sp. BE141]
MKALRDHPDQERLRADARRVLADNLPAGDAELGQVIFGLLIMYAEFDRRAEASKTMVVTQWRQSLKSWPRDVLERAAQSWISGPKAAFVPQPGDILAQCQRHGAFRRAMAKKAREFLDFKGDTL